MTIEQPTVRLRARGAGVSDVGLQREHNEDSFALVEEHGLFLVADGMGGHRAGDVASKIASESIAEFFQGTASDEVTWPYQFDARLSDEENRLQTAIRLANRHIQEHSSRSTNLRGMGTTIVGALFSGGKRRMYIGHVGDSRAYRIRDGHITQLTRDHSLVNEYLVAMPDMTDEQKSELPKNVITRALGMQDNVEVDLQSDDVQTGDVYVLCSDGLTGMLKDRHICNAAMQYQDLEQLCRHLVTMANEYGGEDNITVVAVRIEDEQDGDASRSGESPIEPARIEDLADDGDAGEFSEVTQPGYAVGPMVERFTTENKER